MSFLWWFSIHSSLKLWARVTSGDYRLPSPDYLKQNVLINQPEGEAVQMLRWPPTGPRDEIKSGLMIFTARRKAQEVSIPSQT